MRYRKPWHVRRKIMTIVILNRCKAAVVFLRRINKLFETLNLSRSSQISDLLYYSLVLKQKNARLKPRVGPR